MQLIPLQATPNQTLAVTLASQSAQLAIRQNGANLYLDLQLDDVYIVRTRICRDRQRLLLDVKYKGFVGDLVFVDTQGIDNPQYSGLGGSSARFLLIYLADGE